MKKIICNTALKILAVTLSFVVFFTMLISAVGSILMLFGDFYTRDFSTLEKGIMKSLAQEEAYKLVSLYDNSEKSLQTYYEDKNILYSIENLYTGEKISNFNGEKYIAQYSSSEFIYRFISRLDGSVYENDSVQYNHEYNYYYHYATNNEVDKVAQKINFTIYIPKNMQFTDRFFLVNKIINMGYENRYTTIFLAVLSICLTIVIYSYLFISVGHRSTNADIKVALINNIPVDILSVIVFFIYVFCMFIFSELTGLVMTVAISILLLIVLYFVTLWFLLSVVVQIKSNTFIKHTLLHWIFVRIIKLYGIIKHIYKNLATVYKAVLLLCAFWCFLLIFIGFNAYENDNLIIGFIFITAIASALLLLTSIAFQRVKKGGEKIVNGDLENKIDTSYMFGDIKDFADSLNNINQGLQTAIDDKMKSERFKTELITNVSHDIKTPLTSIVSYVDLIKKENCENEKVNEYITVLDRQSTRLKKLIEDLVEVSKASTGNLSVELTKCNLSLLINQAIGEFGEKLENKGLKVVQTLTNTDVYILADGRRLWRVFDNLLNNICKYAMSDTRVYIDLVRGENIVSVIFKNISESPIDMQPSDLTERFVRGDRSRNTEGSGLGLSIAKSLTELQNGIFEISTDGDLFKVKLTFKIIN